MLANEYYRRSLMTLAEVELLHVSFRSIHYPLLERCPQCAIMRRYVHYLAPDRLRHTAFGCNPVAEPERGDLVQVGGRAYHRQPRVTEGVWAETEALLKAPQNLPTLISGWTSLPGTGPNAGGVFKTIAFHIPTLLSVTLDGSERRVYVLPVEAQHHPRLYFPGDPIKHGPALSVEYRGERHSPKRIVERGDLYVDARNARPLRYRSTVTATIEDGVSVVLDRSHVRFRCNSSLNGTALGTVWAAFHMAQASMFLPPSQ